MHTPFTCCCPRSSFDTASLRCACPGPAAIVNSLLTWDSVGQTYHLAGPDVLSIKQLVKFTFDTIRERNTSYYLPAPVAKLIGRGTDVLAARTPIRLNYMFSEVRGGGGCEYGISVLRDEVRVLHC